MKHSLALIAATAWIFVAAPARADDIEDAQAVIESQIEAFLREDAAAAYAHAAPGIQRMYPNPDLFFEMVKRGYAPVFRPGNFAFGKAKPASDGKTIVQEVLIGGTKGKDDWTAVYVLEKQDNGEFRINGVHMLKSQAPQI